FADGEPYGLKSGDQLHVTGVRVGTQVAAYGGIITSSGTTSTAAMCTPIGQQKSVVLLVTFPGVPAPAIAPATGYQSFFGNTGRSVSEYWREASYGVTSAAGDVFGWYTLDANYTCDQSGSIRDAAIRAADADVDFRQYSRIFII